MPTISSLVRAFVDQAFNEGNLAIVDELVAVNSPTHIPGWGMPANRLGLKQMIINLRAAFPDLYCTVDDEIKENNRSAALWTMVGTHIGLFFGNLPTGRRIETQGIIYVHLLEKRITEGWFLVDQMSILQQLGIVPPPRRNT